MSRWTRFSVSRPMAPPFPSLGFAFERGQLLVPELLEELLQLGERLGARAVEPASSLPPFAHEACLLEHREVLRDGGLRDIEMPGDLARRQLAPTDQRQDLTATG